MSKLSVDAKEAAVLVKRLCGGTLELRESAFSLKAPSLDFSVDVRRFEIQAVVEKGPVKADIRSVAIHESGVEVEFALQ